MEGDPSPSIPYLRVVKAQCVHTYDVFKRTTRYGAGIIVSDSSLHSPRSEYGLRSGAGQHGRPSVRLLVSRPPTSLRISFSVQPIVHVSCISIPPLVLLFNFIQIFEEFNSLPFVNFPLFLLSGILLCKNFVVLRNF